MTLGEKQTVVAVDDSADDLLLLDMAFRDSERLELLHKVGGGEDIVAYLRGEGEFADRERFPIPDLVLLDLKMPRVSGFEVLEQMQMMDLPKEPVVVVFSCSALPKDMHRAYELGARFYQVKPSTVSELGAVMKQLESYMSVLSKDAACVV